MDNVLREKLGKIQRLMSAAGTVGEAEAAAAAMQRLVLKHNLDTADLEGLGETEREEYISRYIVLGSKGSSGLQWRINLAYVMGEMNFCAFIREGFHGGTGWMVGQASNVDAAEEMFKSIAEANERLAPTEWYSFRNSSRYDGSSTVAWKNSFKIGFVAGIRMKMRMERQTVAQELEAGVVSSLVVVKEAELKEAVAEKIGKTTTHKGSAPTNVNGYQRGVEKGLSHELQGRLGR